MDSSIIKYFSYNEPNSVTSALLVVIGTCVLWKLLNGIVQWCNIRRKGPPGPWGLPIVGYLPFLSKDPNKTFLDLKEKYGDIFSIYMGRRYTVVLSEYNVMKEVLSNTAALDKSPDMLAHLGLSGFNSENGERWVEQRRFCVSTARELGLYGIYWEDLIMEGTSDFIKFLRGLKGKPTEISHELELSLSSNIIGLLIGRRLQKDEADKLQLCVDYSDVAFKLTSPIFPSTIMPIVRKICILLKIGEHDVIYDIFQRFSSFIREEIALHKTSPRFHNVQDFINSYLKKISELSESKKTDHCFSESMLEGNLNILFLGSTDSIFCSMGWLFRLMCKHKDVQEKVYAELMEVLGKDGTAKYDERDRIPYTFAVIMEAQRFGSIVHLIGNRRCTEDIHVKGYVIPKGSDITANIWFLHHDPAYWDEPEVFRPERFLTDGGTKLIKHPPSFVPFSVGRRNCPGETIAWTEILLYFTEILKKFEISTPVGVEPDFEYIYGILARLVPQPLCFKERNI